MPGRTRASLVVSPSRHAPSRCEECSAFKVCIYDAETPKQRPGNTRATPGQRPSNNGTHTKIKYGHVNVDVANHTVKRNRMKQNEKFYQTAPAVQHTTKIEQACPMAPHSTANYWLEPQRVALLRMGSNEVEWNLGRTASGSDIPVSAVLIGFERT